jgi:hypothetical protein
MNPKITSRHQTRPCKVVNLPSFGSQGGQSLYSYASACISIGQWSRNPCSVIYCVFLCFAGEEQAQRFLGNESHKDHFKLLEKDQNSLLVGAR